MRDVNNGWLIRYIHSNTASGFFFLVSLFVSIFCFYLCVLFIISIVNPPVYSTPLDTNNSLLRKGEGNRGHTSNPKNPLDSLSDEDFSEWFRGFVDAEGCFLIQTVGNGFKLVFTLCLHKDEIPLLNYLAQRLGVGFISVREKSVSYTVSSKGDLLKIFSIFDKQSLNTSKNLNYIMLRQAYDLYFNRESIKVSMELRKKMMDLKNQMNKKRIDFNQTKGHSINITRNWLLGFIEGDGFFSVNQQNFSLRFGIGQTSKEIGVLEAIQKFVLGLPGKHLVQINNINLVQLGTYNPAKGRDNKPMALITVTQREFITNVLIPFFDNLIWLSKKEKDYQDWKLILNIINQGKHFTAEGKELISLISKRMNSNRLSTNLASLGEGNSSLMSIGERAIKLLSTPSNYEVQPDGKILIKSLGTCFKGRGKIGVKVLDEKGELYNFNSIKDCALFFNVHSRTINRRLDSGSFIEFNGKKLVFKREVYLP